MYKYAVLLLFAVMGGFRSFAYDGIVLQNSNQIISISDKIKYQKISTPDINNWELIIKNSIEHPSQELIYRQIHTEYSIITFLNLMNKVNEELFIQLSDPTIDHIILVDLTGNSQKIIYKGGNNERKYIDNIRLSKYLLDLDSKGGGQKSYALIISDDKPLENLEISIGALKKFLDDRPEINLLEGMFFGVFLLLVFYSLFQFFMVKDPSYIYFGLYAASLSLLFAIMKGYTIEYFLGELPNFETYVQILICSSGVMAILFTTNFMKTIINTPRRHMWLMAFMVFYGIGSLIILFNGGVFGSKLIYYNTLLTIFFFLYVSVTMWKRGFKPSINFLLAWVVLLAGMMASTLLDLELLPYNLFTENILQLAALIHIVLLSFALAMKIRIYIDKKNEAQEMALETAIENEKLITHQKQMLETRVFERTKDLEQSIEALKKQEDQLQEANAFKDKVFSVISHDLKSPVSTLTGLLELLKLNSLSKEEKSTIINNLEVALKNTKYLLDNILNWANPKLNKGKINTQFHLYSVVDEIFQLFSVQANAKNINLNNFIDPTLKIKTDKNIIRLVLRNLISNALKFTPTGGKVEVTMEMAGRDVMLMVKDNGIGIGKTEMEMLFERNHHHTTRGTENEKGTGLGLILCREFLEKNRHKIWAESEKGKGSVFYISLHSVLEKNREKVAV